MSKTSVDIEKMLINFLESQQQAEYDLSGEQRDWHLPRLNKVFLDLTQLFPFEIISAMEKMKTP